MINSERPPRIGKLAEHFFEGCCNEASCTSNRVQDDQEGWDFIVDFPPVSTNQLLDLRPGAISCVVQVKSTASSNRTAPLKLSNALRFVRHALPCFVVLVEYEADRRTRKAVYLQHFWEPQMRATLETARKAAVRRRAPNKVIVPVRFAEADRCSEDELLSRMKMAVEAVGGRYDETKRKIADEAGYEEGRGTGKFSVDVNQLSTFVDMMIGLAEEAPVEDIELREKRFGVENPTPVASAKSGRMSAEVKPVAACTVTLRKASGGEEVQFDGEVFVAAIPDLPLELRKIRIQAEFVRLVLAGDSSVNIHASFNTDAPIPIERAEKIAAVWSMLDDQELLVQVWSGSQRVFHGTVRLQASEREGFWASLHKSLRDLLQLFPATRWPSGAALTVFDLVEGLPHIRTFLGRLRDPGLTLTIGETPEAPLLLDRKQMLQPFLLDLEQVTLFAVTERPIEAVTLDGNSVALRLSAPVLHSQIVLQGAAASNWSFMLDETKAVADRHPFKATAIYSFLPDEPPTASPT